MTIICIVAPGKVSVGELLSNKMAARLGCCSLLLCFLWSTAAAQQPTSSNADSSTSAQASASQQNPTTGSAPQQNNPSIQPAPSDKSKQQNDQGKKGTSNDRLFYALPNFLSMENSGKLPPLTAKEKFAVVTRSS